MFEKDRIGIDISSDRMAIVIGTKTRIKKASILATPKGSYVHDRIENVDLLAKVLKDYLVKEKIKVKEVMFNVKGQDIITRHTILPLLSEEPMREAIQWELKQYLNDRIDEYYYDYEVIQEIGEAKTKNADIIIAAVEQTKIDPYLELAEKLRLNLVSIDTYATVGARVLKNSRVHLGGAETVGLITLNSNSSSFHILNSGKLDIEKYQNIGILGPYEKEIDNVEDYKRYLQNIDLSKEEKHNEESINAEKIISTISSYFNSIIQFYSVGKVKKNLDKIFIIGTGSSIKGIKEVFARIFNTEIVKIEDVKMLKYSLKVPSNVNLDDYFYSYGLLLNNGGKELNLIPYYLRAKDIAGKKKMTYIASGVFTVVVLLGGIGYLKGKEYYLNSTKEKLNQKISSNQENVSKLNNLESDIAIYNAHIAKVKVLNEKKDKKTDDLIRDIQKLIPSEVTISSFNIASNSVSISGIGKSYDKVSEFWANLREDERFKDSHIATISKGEGGENFTLEIVIQGRES